MTPVVCMVTRDLSDDIKTTAEELPRTSSLLGLLDLQPCTRPAPQAVLLPTLTNIRLIMLCSNLAPTDIGALDVDGAEQMQRFLCSGISIIKPDRCQCNDFINTAA